MTAGNDVMDTEGGVGCDISWNVVYPSNKPITCCSVTRGCSAYIQVLSSRRRAHLMNMNSHWQPQRRPSLLVFINTSDPIDGRTVAMDKSCIYCTNTALSGSTLTHSSACVRTEGDPFQLLCVGVCQQCSWRQSPLWRPVFRIDTGPRSACSQGPTWGLMNNGERILRAKGEFASLTGLVMSLNYVFMWRQVKLWSSIHCGTLLQTLCSQWESGRWFGASRLTQNKKGSPKMCLIDAFQSWFQFKFFLIPSLGAASDFYNKKVPYEYQ